MVTPQEVKQYLSQLFYLSLRIQTAAEQIAQYKNKAMKQTPTWSETPKGGHAAASPQAVWIERAIIEQERLKIAAAELLKRERIARQIVELLEDEREKAIIEDYHLHRLSVEKIARKYHYSERQIIRIRMSAYKKLTEEINKRPQLVQAIEEQKERGTRHETGSKNENE